MNKKTLFTSALMSLGLTFASASANADVYYDYARVKSVNPVYHYVKVGGPVEHCYPTRHKKRRHRHGTPTVVGALVGGAIGNAIGENSESTIAGALIGGALAHSSQHSRHSYTEYCETSYEPVRKVRELRGYKVKYRYHGKKYSTFMKHHPGDKVKIRVKVSPAY